MKKYITLLFLLCTLSASAQTSNFNQVFDACVKINTGFAGGIPDGSQLSIAAETLSGIKTGSLPLKQITGKQQPIDGHIYFSADFIKKCIQEKKIFPMAKEYAKRDSKRGTGSNQVLLTTILVPAGKTYTYEIAGCTDEVNIGCVAETTGLFTWKVKTTEYTTKKETPHPDKIDPKKGRSSRRMAVKSAEKYKITVEITNVSKNDCTFAVVAE